MDPWIPQLPDLDPAESGSGFSLAGSRGSCQIWIRFGQVQINFGRVQIQAPVQKT